VDQRQDGDRPQVRAQPHQAGRQEGKTQVRGELFPPPRVHLELRGHPPDLGGPQPHRPQHQVQGRQRPHRRLRDRAEDPR